MGAIKGASAARAAISKTKSPDISAEGRDHNASARLKIKLEIKRVTVVLYFALTRHLPVNEREDQERHR